MAEKQQRTRTPRPLPPWVKPASQIALGAAATAGVIVMLLILAGVFREKVSDALHERDGAAVGDLPLAAVRVITRPRYETAVGTVKPIHESSLASKLLARVLEVNVTAGRAVSERDVLVRLDDADLQARLKQAEAAETTALARQEKAEAAYQRAARLIQTNAISQAEYDQAVAERKGAASDLERARQSVQEARTVLDYATIRAPFSGIVVDKQVESGDTVTPGQVLLTLYDPTRMQMVASVRESLAQKLEVGQTVPAELEALGHQCQATVSEIVPQAEAASRSFAVKVTGPCPPGVYSGMFGRLMLPLEDEELIVVPAAAVRRVGQLTMVDVAEDGSRQRRHVQLGRRIDDDYEVLSGLRPGEKVVLWKATTKGRTAP
ncbi:MAG: efflux RND transporter periplasmic adaptor subunit [Pirellulaceae bacterium]